MASINIVGDYKISGLKKRDITETAEAVFFVIQNSKFKIQNEIQKADNKTINVAFVEPEEIQKRNCEYRGIDKPTDVLSFDYGDEGDTLLCLDLIQKMKEDSEELSEAVQKTLIHGVLHLFGYDHENDKDRDIMEELEEKIYFHCHSRGGGNL